MSQCLSDLDANANFAQLNRADIRAVDISALREVLLRKSEILPFAANDFPESLA